MHFCDCGNTIKNTRAKVCVVCRNRAICTWRAYVADEQWLRSRSREDEHGCWLWQGSIDPNGYGRIGRSQSSLGEGLAHRLAYRIMRGPISHTIDHLCRVPRCVNPAHMEDVPNSTNVGRSPALIARLAKTACVNGHAYVDGSFFLNFKGARTCRVCQRAANRESAAKRKARSLNPPVTDGDLVVGGAAQESAVGHADDHGRLNAGHCLA